MPADQSLQKVMVIGSGPIVIGQAAEFDYAGTQACRALREEGLTVVLVNSNPATIMTDANIADRVYIEPLTPEFVTRILRQERPDALLPTLGGQVGLNLARELAKSGVLAELGVRLLGTPLTAIEKAEDRELFKQMLESIGEPVPESLVAESVDEALAFADKTGFPLIVRPAYTLGGTGGGVAHTREELAAIMVKGLKYSVINQVLVERSVAGWKEIEFEVMRDRADNCITICSMENIDPMGIHTGDSIVVAPAQTLTDREYQMLRQASLKIIRALGIQGGCNIQFALNPESFEYMVIEVNPRVSRSSALASKATGYPIAKVAAKIAIGKTLDEIKNAVTGKTYACFEPALDYVVVKIPRWPFDKFAAAARTLGTQMKATGEVMAIDRSFEPALLKAVRCLEMNVTSLRHEDITAFTAEQLSRILAEADDRRLFALAEAFRRGWDLAEIHRLTKINPFFLQKIKNIINLEEELQRSAGQPLTTVSPELLYRAKAMGFVDAELARLWQVPETLVREYRLSLGIRPVYKMVDTCAAEFEAETPYFYSTYAQEDEAIPSEQQKVVVLGSGPIRIGQGIEFDYCSVHSVWALRQAGYEAIIINNNPETVSTDFDTADRLYFEPLVAEDVIHVLEKEKPAGVIVQFGGQTAINLAGPLKNAGFTILGTTVEDIDRAEDRDRFDQILIELGIAKPPGHTATSVEGALTVARKIGYPVLVRPSYVLGGRAMEIVYNDQELVGYMTSAVRVNPNYPVLVDKYLFGKELEVDAIADGEQVLIPGIMAHVERAGVHSGDSIAVYPVHNLPRRVVDTIVDYTTRLALHLKIRGVLNIQYVLHDDQVFVLEVNPRSSRTVPYLSKITGVPMIAIATNVILGKTLADQGYRGGLLPAARYVAVKVPVFSFAKLLEVETSLGPEMKSTGEVMGVDQDFHKAFFKAIVAAGLEIPHQGTILATIADKDKAEALPLLQEFAAMGYRLAATAGTAQALQAAGVPVMRVNKIDEGSPHLVDLVQEDKVQLIINTLTKGKQPQRDGFRIRRAAVEHAVPCLTSLDTTRVILQTLRLRQQGEEFTLVPLQEYLA